MSQRQQVFRDGKVRALKDGVAWEEYHSKHPEAIRVRQPTISTLKRWDNEGGCKAVDGCWVEPDGICEHGYPSWMLVLNLI